MDYKTLLQKKEHYEQIKDSLPEITVKSYAQAFDLEYTHHSTAIEGNTLTLLETKAVLEDGLSVGGKKLREIYEVINHNKAYQYVKNCIAQKKSLDEQIIKDLHAILMENIMIGGIYRNVDVYIFRCSPYSSKPERDVSSGESVLHGFTGQSHRECNGACSLDTC